jgi:hypothetical protein
MYSIGMTTITMERGLLEFLGRISVTGLVNINGWFTARAAVILMLMGILTGDLRQKALFMSAVV